MKMRNTILSAGFGMLALTAFSPSRVPAQGPEVVAPIVVDTAVPIIVNAVKPKTPAGQTKFEGFVMNANIAQITVRAKGSDMSIQTFTLSQAASAKMQTIVDKGGYQYGDKVTIYYNSATLQVVHFKGKPSKAL
jgi:hypothetical protein